jgi:pimeloyl-ACP methyl ester carboxylesterase
MKTLRRLLIVIVGFLAVAAAGFAGYALLVTAEPQAQALAALETGDQVQVTTGDLLVFQPAGRDPRAGLILYPGGFVDPRAYAPPAREIAAAGYLVVIPPVPLNLAVLAPGRAAEIIDRFPEIAHWAVGGHSLGGAMAAQFAADNPDQVAGLVLWGAYPPGGVDLSDREMAVLSVYGTRDGLTSIAEIDGSRGQLPPASEFVAIDGGNHAQFGWYGPQNGDLAATVTQEEQQTQVVAATVRLMARLTDGGR